jgi:Mn-dependent DtxR family transcriptional regulator
MGLQESGEMYLETIYVLLKENSGSGVRSVDIGAHMGYSKPSVSRAVGLLKNGGFINVDKDGFITLTDEGKKRANKIYDRHNTLTEILTFLGVDKETASEDACKIEHVISDTSFNAIKEYLSKNK